MDSGTIMLPDTGVTPDSGGGTGDCEPMTVPAPTEATCTTQQITDLQTAAMTSNDAIASWYESNPDCGSCVDQGLLSCATMMGCDDEWGSYNCCAEDNCGSATTQDEFNTCVDTMCGTEYNSFSDCLGSAECGIDSRCVM